MVKLNKKIKAGTLIEVIVALLIILIVYGILVLFIQNLSKQLKGNTEKIEAFFITEKTLNQTIQDHQFFDEEFILKEITFTKTVTQYKNYKNLFDVTIKAHNKNKKLLVETEQIIYAQKD